MAPHVAPPSPTFSHYEEVYDVNVPFKKPEEVPKKAEKSSSKYSQYLPTWEPVFFDPLPPFEFVDPALHADKAKRNLLKDGVVSKNISPKMGTELTGIQLTELSNAAKDELALLVAERKCVVIRDQNFKDTGPAFQQEFANYFGKPHYQPVTGSVPGYPGFHIIYRDGNQAEIQRFFQQKSTANIWHHDVSYERQPPGYVFLCILQCPEVGGDTVVASMTEAYK
jgi:sulfonate dioxygenase